MARKKRTSKIQPSVRTLTFPIGQITSTTTNKYIDLSQCASLVNRRFYRQGINWAVSGFTLHTSAGTGSIQISKVPNTWVASNAWEKSMRVWLKQQNEAVDDAGARSAVAAFRDFKVFADEIHANEGIVDNLLPAVQKVGTPVGWEYYQPGEWEASEIVLPNYTGQNPTERKLHFCGANVNGVVSRGMIEGYADSRAFPQSPDPVSPVINDGQNWMAYMFDTGNDISPILENATDRNDHLPYPQVEYPGGETQASGLQYHDQLNITATSVSGKTTARGTTVPCGLLKLRIDTSLGALPVGAEYAPISWLQIHLVPGSHKGYLCEPMTDM